MRLESERRFKDTTRSWRWGGEGGGGKKAENVKMLKKKKKKEITTLIDAAGRHMRRHMEKLPQRPAIIDSLQRCSLLGTFTNKGRPINVSHADQAGNWECVCVCGSDR